MKYKKLDLKLIIQCLLYKFEIDNLKGGKYK